MGKYKKKSLAKKITLTLLTTTVWVSLSSVGYAANLPTGGSVEQGTFDSFNGNPTATTTTITQTSDRGVLNWDSFDVGTGYTVNFKQPDISSMTLNKVTGNSLSTIAGTINANGSIAIVNPNGLFFAEGSTVNAAGIVASTADIDSDSFMNGTLVFSQDNTVNGDVTINGTLNAETNNASVNSALNLGDVEAATGFSTMNNVIRLVADGDVKVGETGKLTAVTTTSITQEVDGTIGEEEYTVGESESTTTASSRILIRADQNADDIGTVELNNTDASQIQSKSVEIYYNTDVTDQGIAGTVDDTTGLENGTSTVNITGNVDTTDKYTQKDYTTYDDDKVAYKDKIATTIYGKNTDLETGENIVSTTATSTSSDVYMLVNNIEQVAAIEDGTYGNLDGEYAQGTDIDASDTLSWNSGKGFHPIGGISEAADETKGTTDGANFTGLFTGNGGTAQYSISDLEIR
jgi:filamentous hemagglutinin family protein